MKCGDCGQLGEGAGICDPLYASWDRGQAFVTLSAPVGRGGRHL